MDEPDQDGHSAASLALAAGLPVAGRDDWRALVAAVLAKSGVPVADPNAPEDALAHAGYDGFEILPLYTAEDRPAGWEAGAPGHPPFVRGARPSGAGGWDVRQRHADPDPELTNRAVLADLANGVSSLWLVLGDGGLAVSDLATALAGVQLDLAPIVLDAGDQTLSAAAELFKLADSLPVGELRGGLGADPIGWAARTGTAPDLTTAVRAAELAADYPELVPITVDATVYHDAGGSDSTELAISMAAGVGYLRALTEAGHGLADAFASLEFRYAVTANQFDSIIKLRAARMLWDRIGELSGPSSGRRGQRQHAVTSAAMFSRRDPWVNILRATVGCFAAAVGGAEAITVIPFDSALGLPDELGRRIARNTQSVLHDESSLARVSDPAGGSYYVEAGTEQLAEAAWQKFTELERDGGLPAASGALAERLAQDWQRRQQDLAHRRVRLIGVTEYASLDEQPLTRRPSPTPAAGGLPRHRYAEPFEALRDRSDELLASRGSRPRIFLAALGPAAAHAARAGFVRNLAQVGGIEPVLGTGGPDELAAAFTASGAAVGCLCSTDHNYAEQAGPVVAALRAAGARQVWLAGRPDIAAELGVDAAVYQGCDVLASLHALYELVPA
ncbi:MAG TPA: methylmalonyl-CoA mutase subunit beta [Jatrophihabitans sp.]|nr:methylmalonyl-CoA mutase subunit beta [Jatrophihabitans sp.]